MKLLHLEYFCAIARNGSFTKAAEEIHVAQPYLTKCMNQLKKELGGRALFKKQGRGVAITPEGHRFYTRIQSALNEIDSAATEFKNNDITHESITLYIAEAPLLFSCYLPYFRSLYPEIGINLRNSIVEKTDQAYSADILITSQDQTEKGFHSELLIEDKMVLLIPSSIATAFKENPRKSLESIPFVIDWPESNVYHRFIELCKNLKLTPNIQYTADSVQNFLFFLTTGAGASFVPLTMFYYLKKDSISRNLIPVLITNPESRYRVFISWKDNSASSNCLLFVEHFKNVIEEIEKDAKDDTSNCLHFELSELLDT